MYLIYFLPFPWYYFLDNSCWCCYWNKYYMPVFLCHVTKACVVVKTKVCLFHLVDKKWGKCHGFIPTASLLIPNLQTLSLEYLNQSDVLVPVSHRTKQKMLEPIILKMLCHVVCMFVLQAHMSHNWLNLVAGCVTGNIRELAFMTFRPEIIILKILCIFCFALTFFRFFSFIYLDLVWWTCWAMCIQIGVGVSINRSLHWKK